MFCGVLLAIYVVVLVTGYMLLSVSFCTYRLLCSCFIASATGVVNLLGSSFVPKVMFAVSTINYNSVASFVVGLFLEES